MCDSVLFLYVELKEQIRDGTSTSKMLHTKAAKVTETEQSAKNRKKGDLDVARGLQESWESYDKCYMRERNKGTVMPTKSDSDVIFCLQLLSKTLTLNCISANANR